MWEAPGANPLDTAAQPIYRLSMLFKPEHLSELNLLAQFQAGDPSIGIKVHSTAAEESVSAAARLYKKGLTTQVDGGYLTPLGLDAAQQAQTLLRVLRYEQH